MNANAPPASVLPASVTSGSSSSCEHRPGNVSGTRTVPTNSAAGALAAPRVMRRVSAPFDIDSERDDTVAGCVCPDATQPMPASDVSTLVVPLASSTSLRFVVAFLCRHSQHRFCVALGTNGNGNFVNRTDRPSTFGAGTLVDQTNGGLRTEISKRAATGTQFFARNITEYTRGNTLLGVNQPIDSIWQTTMEAEIRQPILQNRGTLINRLPVML